ncbi:MAG: hypothetical protein BWY63_03661 [Chloroflexi bacterium ADurb.Bin360]|nr:MAG: hypothetical protein BWY63_03661 [Chloroflexi bacterium ADurb.Bin360]
MDQTACERQLLLHATRKASAQSPGESDQPGKFQQLRNAPFLFIGAHTVHIGEETHALQHGEVRRQGEFLCDVADSFANGIGIAHGIVTQDSALARRAAQQTQNNARCRGLAGAIWSNKAKSFTPTHLQSDTIHGFDYPPPGAESLDQILCGDSNISWHNG